MDTRMRKVLMVICIAALALIMVMWIAETVRGNKATKPLVPQNKVVQEQVLELTATRDDEREMERTNIASTPPELERLEQLVTDFECMGLVDPVQGWNTLIAIGDMYKKGAYPRFVPNEELAMEIFKEAAKCPQGEVAGMAQSRYIETHNNPISIIDRAGEAIPQGYGRRACDEAKRRMHIISMQGFIGGLEKPRLARRISGVAGAERHDRHDRNEGINGVAEYEQIALLATVLLDGGDATDVIAADNTPHVANANTPYVANAEDRSDSQNVHDHGVVAALRTTLTSLPDIKEANEQSAVEGARATVLRMRDEDRITAKSASDALLVIDSLNSNKNGSMGGISERQALARVWQKITDNENCDNLQEVLAKQLATGVEHGNVVCSTGKITRMAATFEGMNDDTPVARPMWAVREELMQVAAKVREDYLAQLSVGDKAVYESGGNIDSAHENAMTNLFEKRVHDEYVIALGMNADVLAPVIAEISSGF